MSAWSTFWQQVKAWWASLPAPVPVPAPAPAPAPGVASFTAIKDHADGRPGWMCGGLILASDGSLYTGLINDPRNPETVEVWRDGVRLTSKSRETIGQPVEFAGSVYFPTESGGSGRWLKCRGASVSEVGPCRHAAATTIYRGRPCIVSSEDRGEMLIDAETGADLLKLAVPAKCGIPFAACTMPGQPNERIIVLADASPDVERIVSTTGIVVSLKDAMAIENWNGRLIAGTKQGKLWWVDLTAGTVRLCADTGSQMVNHLWYDVANAILWCSCSGPDRLLYYDAAFTVHQVAVIAGTEAKMLKTRVVKGWWVAGDSATWYRIVATSTPQPSPTPAPAPVTPPSPVSPGASYAPGQVPYSGQGETIVNRLDGQNDIRALINWQRPDGNATWLSEKQVRRSVHFSGKTMTVTDIALGDGVWAHYLGYCQPSSKSPLVAGNPVQVGRGTLRLVYEARRLA